MRRRLLLVVIIMIGLLMSPHAQSTQEQQRLTPATVVRVIDGDTIEAVGPDVDKFDIYRRQPAYVWITPPTSLAEDEIRECMFNAMLLLEGYALTYTVPPNVKYADGCRYLAQSRIPMSLAEALWRWYGPCTVCKPVFWMPTGVPCE